MQLNALRYFLMVASYGSFLETARHFQTPPSSVSRAISALEKELGQQLFYRSTRAVSLTEAGEQFYVQVRDGVELLDQAAEQLSGLDADIRGLVKINAPEALGRLHVAPAVNALQAKYPNLTVELTLTDVFIDPVVEAIDITIRVSALVDSGLIGKVIAPHRHVVAASPRYLAEHGVPASPEELLEHQCLVYKGQLGIQKWYYRRESTQAPIALNVSGPLRSNNSDALLEAAVAGQGVVLFPTWLITRNVLAGGQLVQLLPSWEISAQPEKTYIQMLSPANRLRSRKVREVSEFLLGKIGTPPYWECD